MRLFPKGLGWTIAAMVIPVAVMLAQHGSGKKHQKTAPVTQPQHDPEAPWACRLGYKVGYGDNAHECHCPRMVARIHTAYIAECHTKYDGDRKEFEECMNHQPAFCDVIQKPDLEHPQDSCQRWCSKPVCRCADGPSCHGPEIVPHPSPEEGQQDW